MTALLLRWRQRLTEGIRGYRRAVALRPDESTWLGLRPVLTAVLIVGALLRLYLVFFTEGTYDVRIWEDHARGVFERGLVGQYHHNRLMNHPPLMGVGFAGLSWLSDALGISFRILLRLPFAIFDLATAGLVLWLLRDRSWRFAGFAAYWLHPLAIIYSAYHGNTDSALPFFVLLAIALVSKRKAGWAGAALGVSLWIKLPGVLAAPALFFAIRGWKARAQFAVVLGLVGALTYLPVLLQDPDVLIRNVFGFRGQMIHTSGHVPVWGMQVFLPLYFELSTWRASLYAPVRFFFEENRVSTLGLLVLLAFLRRGRNSTAELIWTVAGCFTVFHGFSLYWSFQYFAWIVPLWVLLGSWQGALASVLASAYIYTAYAVICGNPWLLGQWDFHGHPQWPEGLVLLRNAAQLFLFSAAIGFLLMAVVENIRVITTKSPDERRPGE